jgi:hypothetical protein
MRKPIESTAETDRVDESTVFRTVKTIAEDEMRRPIESTKEKLSSVTLFR